MATITTPEVPIESRSNPRDEILFEVIDGRVMERPPMGTYPVELASILHEYLGPFVRQAGLGRAVVEMLFRIDARAQYRPDLAFVSHVRWPVTRRSPNHQPWEIIPDVAVEVISKNDSASDLLEKVHNYLEAGTRAVWLVYPNLEVVHVYESFTRVRILTRADTLDGGDVIPGFTLPLETLFQGEKSEEDGDETAD